MQHHQITAEAEGREAAMPATRPVPLVVDLEDTLVLGNLMIEAVIVLLKQSVHYVLLLPFWLRGGPAGLLRELSSRVQIDASTVLFNQPLVDHLKREKARGRPLYLVAGADEVWARRVADQLGLFDGVLATDGADGNNRQGRLATLRDRFADTGFDYAGNIGIDDPIWRAARRTILVSATPRTARWAAAQSGTERVFPKRSADLTSYLRALRLHQWLKNLLLFAPLIAALRFASVDAFLQVGIGFLAFSLCASSVYLLNDIIDVHDDRSHPRKRRRPFAAGELSITQGLALIPVLLGAAIALAAFLPWQFGLVLAIYYATTLAYTLKLKQLEVVDVFALALLYTTRIFAGAAAVGIALSFWLLAFSIFIFLTLALAKRCTELVMQRDRGNTAAAGRGYRVTDLHLLFSMGTGAGYVAALVLGLYINSPAVEQAYANPEFLWGLVPLLIFWITRVWLKTYRGDMHDDPLVFAARDPVSLVVAAAFGAAIWAAL